MLSTATVDQITLMGGYDDDQEIDGVEATCNRCGRSEEAYGTSQKSIDSCFVRMSKACPQSCYLTEGKPTPKPKTEPIKFRLFLDFEYRESQNSKLELVCCVTQTSEDGNLDTPQRWWLHKDPSKQVELKNYLLMLRQCFTFCAFAVTAEARSMLALGLDPTEFKWFDIMIEYRMLVNNHPKYSIGKHYFKAKGSGIGRVKTLDVPVPKWERTEGYSGGDPEFNFEAARYKMLGIKPKSGYKDGMRHRILEGGPFSLADKEEILEYCESDVVDLPKMGGKIKAAILSSLRKEHRGGLEKDMLLRGEYAARTAKMEEMGYPIDYGATRNFSDSAPDIVKEIQKEICDLFPEVVPFAYNPKKKAYEMKINNIRAWVEKQNHKGWMKTDGGAVSLALEAFEKKYPFRHDYPKDCLGAQMVRLLKTKQSLNGFLPGKRNSFWDKVGEDKRVRPYMGIYRAQSARSQPSATGFIPLKSAWMRSLIQPKPGRTIIAVDYAQQEFLLAALISKDAAMIKAYHSGDPYLATAKLAGAIPQDGTKEKYGDVRDRFKSTVLGIQYGMGYVSLAGKITTDTGKFCSEDEAKELITDFYEMYPDYKEWQDNTKLDYYGQEYVDGDEYDDQYLRLPCGWIMWGNNKNPRSVTNMPIQGLGSSIMRKGVALAQDAGLEVIFTLHDALYIECDTDKTEESVDTLAASMRSAMKHYFQGTPMDKHAKCRMDPTVWGPDWTDQSIRTDLGPITPQKVYVDKRSRSDYEKFSKYFSIL